jgi:hypothetical protein
MVEAAHRVKIPSSYRTAKLFGSRPLKEGLTPTTHAHPMTGRRFNIICRRVVSGVFHALRRSSRNHCGSIFVQ